MFRWDTDGAMEEVKMLLTWDKESRSWEYGMRYATNKGVEITAKGRRLLMNTSKFVSFLTALYVVIQASVPQRVQLAVGVATFFVFMDTLTGLWTAYALGELSSGRMLQRTVSKLVLHAIFWTIVGGAAVLGGNWFIFLAAPLFTVHCETISMLENMAKLQYFGKVNLGPLAPYIAKISKSLLIIPAEEAGNTVENIIIKGGYKGENESGRQDNPDPTQRPGDA